MRELLVIAVLSFAHGACATDTVGSTSQEVIASQVINQSKAFDNAGADSAAFGVACEIDDPNTMNSRKLMIDAGGIESGGTYSDDAVLFIPGVGYDANARITFTDNRAYAVMTKDPTDVNACLMFGGEDGSSVKGQIVQLKASWSGSVYSLAATNKGVLSTARSRLQAVVIDSRVFLQGGFTSIGKSNPSNVMDVWSGETNTTAIATLKNQNNVAVTLNTARGDFGAERSGTASTRRIVLAGGGTNTIEAFEVDSNGKLTTTATHPSDVTSLSSATIGTARDGLMVVYSGVASGVETYVAGPGSGLGEIKKFTINWSTISSSTGPATACTIGSLNAVTDPLNIKLANGQFIIVGDQNTVQEYDGGTCTSVTTDSSSTALVNRQGALGASVDGHAYYTAGRDGLTFHTTTYKVH